VVVDVKESEQLIHCPVEVYSSARMSARAKYTRVIQEEAAAAVSGTDQGQQSRLSREDRKRKRTEDVEWYSLKIQALLWCTGAAAATYFSDIINVCISSKKVNRFWFNAGVVCLTIAAVLVCYMAIWVPRVLKIQYEPQVYSPRLLPVTGAFSILCGLFFIVGLWPVYGFLTPAILFVIWVGGLMSSHFIPVF